MTIEGKEGCERPNEIPNEGSSNVQNNDRNTLNSRGEGSNNNARRAASGFNRSNDNGEKYDPGCEGPNSEYIKLISSDDHEFIIKRKYAILSGTIDDMLTGPGQFGPHETNIIYLRDIPSHALHVVCLYLEFKHHSTINTSEPQDFSIPPNMAIDLLMASKFLDC